MEKPLEKKALTPTEVDSVYGIPKGSLANMRWARTGPKYYKTGARKVLYRTADIEAWLFRNPVLTVDSVEVGL